MGPAAVQGGLVRAVSLAGRAPAGEFILIRHIRGMRSCWWSEDGQLIRLVVLTVTVRSIPGLSVRCGTRVAR
jgi:hypothetical protein